jgi:ribonuclease PH
MIFDAVPLAVQYVALSVRLLSLRAVSTTGGGRRSVDIDCEVAKEDGETRMYFESCHL